ncbi:uncharacterized protein GBIM_02438 [Gryllus bimaculatus]|nr:uncharacterized protein GBIM_02438 [Gryllus bimaculatus]
MHTHRDEPNLIANFQIGDIGPGSYNLSTKSVSGGFIFQNTTTLEYVHKSYSVFIQTDKAIYKPGHKVQFRIIVLNTHLKPNIKSALDFYIADGKGNRVKLWKRAVPRNGVFSAELQLSESPVLGDWSIVVTILDQTFQKSFHVAEYVLPKFEVTVDVPPHGTFKDSHIVATVHAKYTYGKPVRGEATITVYPNIFSGVIQPIFQNPIRKVVPIDGKAIVEFDIKNELQLEDDFERTIQLDVAVEEELTGRRQNNSAQIVLHKHKYKMELVKTSDYFKPGLKYTAFVKLAHHDDTPVQDERNPVKIRYGFTGDPEQYTEESHNLPKNGIIELNFYPPLSANQTVSLGIEAEYLDLKEWFSTISAAMSPSDTFIQVIVKTDKPKVGEDVVIEVNSTASLKYFMYQVVGRGDIIVSKTITTNGRNTYQARFLATYAMAPTAHVIVSYLKDDGEVVADAIDIEIDGMLQNFVNVESNPQETQPGGAIDLKIEAKPNSYIGLLGIDQSVLLLRSGNDITRKDVLEELRSYDSGRSYYLPDFIGRNRFKRSLFWWPGSSTAHEVFDRSGTVILTNGHVFDYSPVVYYRSNFGDELYSDLSAAPVPAFSAMGLGGVMESGIKIRQHFPETWLWDALDTGSSIEVGSRYDQNSNGQNRVLYRTDPVSGPSTVKPDLGPPVTIRPVTRPPLAGPFAFSRIPPPVWTAPRVFLLHDPASTWLFTNLSSGSDGKASLKSEVPDTITSWVLSAFSIDPIYGLGLIEEPRKIRVFRPFFVSLDLPYSVIRGEIVAIPIVVFNYMNKDLSADVTLLNDGLENFDFAEISNDVEAQSKLEVFRTKKLLVKANSGASVSFMITPRKLGYINIKVTAVTSRARDGVERKLLVKPEGETQFENKAIFVDLRSASTFKTNISLNFPKYFVPESEKVQISAAGDILGPSIPNLANLIKMPFGCGEQNMLNFVPNIVVIDYLRNTRQLTPAVEHKATRYMETGYQQELTYRREDGSFSAFGNNDNHGSTWLTAFVAKSFHQAMPYITVEERIIHEALQWLANNQAANGSFPEVGKVSHKDMQGGAANGVALTAYTLIAFLENKNSTSLYRNTINKALDYVVKNLNGLEDVYAISICTYALHLADHTSKTLAFNLLESKANTTSNMKWWNKVDSDPGNPWNNLPNSVNIEMTSYALLSYLKRGLIQDSLPIMRWLVSQRNDAGGFASTQDTVIGLTALAKLAEQIVSDSTSMTLTFNQGSSVLANININNGNLMILQKHEVSPKVREIEISATGTGFAVIQVSYQYNVNVTGAWPRFTLDPQVDKNSDHNHLQLTICSGFVGSKDGNESNMAVMEVTLPSGFTVDRDFLPSLRVSQNVKRVETKDGDTVVMMYFDKMMKEEFCPTVSAYRTHKVAKQKPVPVTIYDYYDSSRRARMFYEPQKATLCDICEGEDCGDVCSSRPKPRNQDSTADGGSSELGKPLGCIISTIIFTFIVRYM